MSVVWQVERWRLREEAAFTSEVSISRSTGEGEFDPDTGGIDSPDPDSIYEGPALVRSFAWEGTDITTGEREVRLRGARVKLPHDTPVQKDDVIAVTASQNDAGLVGKEYRVTDVLHDEWQIVRVAMGEEVTGGPEEESS